MYASNGRTHIPQPPHTAGMAYKGLRAAIDPHQIPSPIEVVEADRDNWNGKPYMTLPGSHVPLSTTDYVAIDQGNSSPKFIRVSTWNVPSSSRLASECDIPIAAVIQPFADLHPQEELIPIVDTGSLGPARCAKCRGYINPWCTWTAGGARWKCNLCGHETEVAAEYFCNLDANLLRLDHLQRPELNKGTVDFVVPEEYWARQTPPRITPLYHPVKSLPKSETKKPKPMDYIFVFEVSADAIASGLVANACASLGRILYGTVSEEGAVTVEPSFPSGSRIAIITFDSAVHFYNLSPHQAHASMLVVPDVDEMFVPLLEGLFVDSVQSRAVVENLLSSLSQMHSQTTSYRSALGSALLGSLSALEGRGGQVVAFASTLPTMGAGALKPRDDESSLYDTDKEISLYAPRSSTWTEIGEQCADEGVGVNLFLGSQKSIDIGSVGAVASLTGGELFYHHPFDAVRDGYVIDSQLRRLVSRTTGYNCAMRVRCSNGLRIKSKHGHFWENAAGDFLFGTLNADKAVSVVLEHAQTIDDRGFAFIQSAVLYTSADGQRRVRTCNLALQVVSLAGNVFRFADMDTVITHMTREAVSKLTSQKASYIHEELTEKCGAILLGYRKNCAAATAPSQLVIPEAFRAIPVYTLAMMKCKALRARNMPADIRNYWIHKLQGMSVRSTMHHLYPRLLALHDLDDEIALPDPNTGRIELPALMRDSHLFMEGHGVYLIDNEEIMTVWIGLSVSPQILRDLFGVEDVHDLDRYMTHLPRLQSRLSQQVHNILTSRYQERGRIPKFYIARQNMDGAELEFGDNLVEDQNNAAMSYLDYLCIVHKQISTALTTGASLSGNSTFRGSIW